MSGAGSMKSRGRAMFSGAFTALVTPFRNGSLDEKAYRDLIEWQISEGINGLVPCGTTGESATLSHEEHERVISICIDQVKKRVPVIAGAGSNNTKEATRLLRYAKEAGADAALLITPYYNKPTPEGLFQHYKTLASEVSIPMIVYNVPGRTGINVAADTMARMFREIPEIVGVKEATGNMTQVSEILEQCGPDLVLLSGDDFTVLPSMALGGSGVISVVSNLIPGRMAALCAACAQGDYKTARELHYGMSALSRACFLETNPIPVKTALGLMKRCEAEFRLPLVPMQVAAKEKLEATLKNQDLV